jgi:hypothetical protein
LTARHTAAPWASGAGGGVVDIGENESFTGVLNALTPTEVVVVVVMVARKHRAGARFESRFSDMIIDRSVFYEAESRCTKEVNMKRPPVILCRSSTTCFI